MREYSTDPAAVRMRQHTAWRRSVGHRSFKVWLPQETSAALEAYADEHGLTLADSAAVLLSEGLRSFERHGSPLGPSLRS